MKKPKREELEILIRESPEVFIDLVMVMYDTTEKQGALIEEQAAIIEKQAALIEEQAKKIQALEDKLNQNSSNSSTPPSKDRYKIKRKKTESTKKGHTNKKKRKHQGPKMVETPDEIIELSVSHCPDCGCELSQEPVKGKERRQEIDIIIQRVTKEYRAEKKRCPNCSKPITANFPKHIKGPMQYGPTVRSLSVYLTQDNMISYSRAQRFFKEVGGVLIGQSTLVTFNQQLKDLLTESDQAIKAKLINAPVVGFDETGMSKNGKIKWLHTATTDKLTFLYMDEKRGKAGMDAGGILPQYHGIAIHDFWKPYEQYTCHHAYCNAHLIRELKAVEETTGHSWASNMKTLLKKAHREKKQRKNVQKTISEEKRALFERRYDTFVQMASHEAHPPPKKPAHQKGRVKKTKELNLLERFIKYKDEILTFLTHEDVPFDNNTAERSFRMAKVKDKVSGSFRGTGDECFAVIRSFTDSVRKNGIRVFDAIRFCFQRFSPLLIVDVLFSS